MAEQSGMSGEVFYPSPEVVANAHIRDYQKVNEAAVADLPGRGQPDGWSVAGDPVHFRRGQPFAFK